MFTGIVEATGTVESIARADPERAGVRLAVTTELDLGVAGRSGPASPSTASA